MLIDELYGSESISEVVIIFYLFAQRITQIYRIMVAWLDNLSDMYSVKFLLYSDNYHLGEYAENPERVSLLCHGACGSDWEVRQQVQC